MVSYGIFDRKGQSTSDFKVDEDMLERVKPYSIINKQNIDSGLLEQFKLGILTELNYEQENLMIHEKSFIDEISVSFSSFCESHKEDKPHYCSCNVNEEKKKIDVEGDEKREFDSVFCNDCGIWYHKDCLQIP